MYRWFAAALLCGSGTVHAQAVADGTRTDAAAAFGARQRVTNVSLSPDGTTLAYKVPLGGQDNALLTMPLSGEGQPSTVIATRPGQPERLGDCTWASSSRMVCEISAIQQSAEYGLLPISRLFALDVPGGGNAKQLSTRENSNAHGFALGGGWVVDWLPEANGTVLMARHKLADDRTGSRIGSDKEGLKVDRIDTRTMKFVQVEPPRPSASEYISDSRGNVRIMGTRSTDGTDQLTGMTHYYYRRIGSRTWETLSDVDSVHRTGFDPYRIDPDKNIAYGFRTEGGKRALYTVSLDGALTSTRILDNPAVDIDQLMTIGPRQRVIGASYATERRSSVYFDPAMEAIAASLHKALPKQPLVDIVAATPDEKKLVVVASSDDDPGVFYVFDRAKRDLHITLAARPELEGRRLANVRPVSFPAADGTMIPGYLTLPAGKEEARGLPAIVMPHGGPEARDEWGFDWLSQFYAAQGYAVLQPNFRGSSGYGLEWFQKNGFRSWRTAIGDVLDAGRWLVASGTADKDKLAIVGWSYGGYAALQSAVVDPSVFKAVVAIAPVTDLALLKTESQHFTNHDLVSNYIGSGSWLRDASPAQNAARIKVPVMLFHGTMDINVGYGESTLMDARLRAANVPHQLVTYKDLDHQLDDSAARADMLRRSDTFLRSAMHL